MTQLNVHLYRDSFNTPWGFRLQGGKDLNQPLIVQRVFSNSPAEGELQRGDVILSINGRDTSQLTHKQAQDFIKHGGGQVQLVVRRPPPGANIAPLSPPIVTQRPRAPSLQSPSSHNNPSYRPNYIPMSHTNHSPYSNPSSSTYNHGYQPQQQQQQQQQQHYNKPMQPLHVHPPPSPQYQRQRSSQSQPPTTPTTPIPPWASQQFEPKRVSKLSKLGGGGFNFGTDYCTLPRRSSLAQYGNRIHTISQSNDYDGPSQENFETDRLASGPPPKVCSLRNLGGGGYDFGTSFGAGSSTLPRRTVGRRLSQPPSMPSSGHMPKTLNLSRLGGGGPEFGSDYTSRGGYGGGGYGQTPAQRYEPPTEKSTMLNRVHTSLDNITLSPHTPEVNSSSPFYQPSYDSQQAVSSYQPPPPTQMYTPTGLLLEQQKLQEQQQQQDEVRTPANKPPPKIPRPRPGPTSYSDFGTDYRSPQQKQSSASWRPQYKPSPVAAPAVSPYSPSGPSYVQVQSTPASWQRPQDSEDDSTPAWRNTLKSTGVKPWERDVNYAQQEQPVRSVPYNPSPSQKSPGGAGSQSGPFSPTQSPSMDVGGSDNGPKVVHLQYNSPMHLYSSQNVAETLKGQTLGLAGQTNKPPQPTTNQSGDRDWSQSEVLRFINQEGSRAKGGKPAPAVAPKPQLSPVPVTVQIHNQHQPYTDDIGVSDF